EQDLCYAALELLDGVTLSEELRAGPLALERAIRIAIQIGRALGAAHQAKLVHRDLRPEHVFLTRHDGEPDFVKVLDFGAACLQTPSGAGASSPTVGTLAAGSPAYMAPEQWLGVPDVDGRVDIYALGAILYQCLAGAPPFSGATEAEWQEAHLKQAIPH